MKTHLKFQLSHFTFCVLIAFFSVYAEEFVPINAMHESGSIVTTTFFNAGGAFPASASSASLNPSIPAAWHYFSQKKMSVFGSFYQNDEINYLKAGGGGSLALGRGQYLSAEYNLKNELDDNEYKYHRGTIAYGAMIGDDKAPLFIGVNLSFYNFKGNIDKSGLLPVRRDTTSRKDFSPYYNGSSSVNYYDSDVRSVSAKNNFIVTDLGFYQPGDGKGLSWGIVLENILGYSWNEYDHVLKNYHFKDTLYKDYTYTNEMGYGSTKTDTAYITRDSAYYAAGNHKSNDFLSKKYNSFLLSTNASIPIVENRVLLMIPADVRFWGFMNKDLRKNSKLKHRTEVHSGFDLQFAKKISARFGWAWIPEEYTTNENGQLNFRGWKNRFSGGFGVNAGVITVDALLAKEAFGIGLSFQI